MMKILSYVKKWLLSYGQIGMIFETHASQIVKDIKCYLLCTSHYVSHYKHAWARHIENYNCLFFNYFNIIYTVIGSKELME